MPSKSLPLVSIITPTYNGAKYLDELILSIRNQDYPAIEHIIIDDGSNDDGATLALLKKCPHVRWWSRENKGQYATMNEGLAAARGDIFCFISADDTMPPGAVCAAVDSLSVHPECDGVYGKIHYMDEKGARYPVQPVMATGPLFLFPYFGFIFHCALYLRKQSVLEKGLLFDPALRTTGDFDWIMNLIHAGLKFRYIPVVCANMRIHPGQTSVRRQEMAKEEQKFIYKRHGVNQFLLRLIGILLTFRSAFFRILHEQRRYGIKRSSAMLYSMIAGRIQRIIN